ncbi:DUF2793 domain-containing protein [Tateyamaria armeniaca]|uniref:DUF2793 domain-containing protein n=1 Tax=Tateyamaria armeniaca TaxID=2518930 RepID=A0ABW8UQ88_9RHOB
MSETSPILSLPYIQPSQAQKHVTHNEALRQLDAIVQLAVISAELTAPPTTPDEGDRYIVAGGASGAWSGQDNAVAVWADNAWTFHAPLTGWRADVQGTGTVVRFDGSDWAVPELAPLQNVAYVGINAAADDTNRLTVTSQATLLNHAGSGHQLKLNKNTDGDTASLLFQTGFSGRAEMGTAGNDDFAVKVSANGTLFNTAIVADAADGAVRFPQGKCYFDEVFIADDAAYGFDIPFSDPARIMMWLSLDLAGEFYLFSVTGTLAGASNFAAMFNSPAGSLNFLSGVLDGTTGPDNAISISIDTSGAAPRMYLENRLGSDRTFTMSTLGK